MLDESNPDAVFEATQGGEGTEDTTTKPDTGTTPEKIIIEDDVWIGTHAVILAGVTVGAHSVIGAGSVVTKDIPPYSIAVGVPAKVIATREQ